MTRFAIEFFRFSAGILKGTTARVERCKNWLPTSGCCGSNKSPKPKFSVFRSVWRPLAQNFFLTLGNFFLLPLIWDSGHYVYLGFSIRRSVRFKVRFSASACLACSPVQVLGYYHAWARDRGYYRGVPPARRRGLRRASRPENGCV